MRIMVAQLNPTVGDMEGNTEKIVRTLASAQGKADIVLFSELVLSGYPPEDLLLHPTFVDAQKMFLDKIIAASSGLFVVVGVVRRNLKREEKPIFNSAAIICDGKLIGFQDKQLLPTYDVFDERRYFEPGTQTPIWEYKGKKIGVLICEDMWQHAGADFVGYTDYRKDPVKELIPERPDVLLNLSASPYHYQKPDVRMQVCVASAKSLRCPVIMCCQVGGNDQLVFDGYSIYLDREGKPRKMGAGFAEDTFLIDLDKPPPVISFTHDHVRDLYSALVLGVRDYMHKLGFTKGCLGLSGGIDSALVACIAVDALGRENVLGISMPSRYSSEGSKTDAQLLAQNLGIELITIPIEKAFFDVLEMLEPIFANRPADITEENMQARIRGLILMAISNKQGYIVLSTGNKSEMGMGYCTLYGDMVGGLSVISDVTKDQVYLLSRFVNREKEIIPRSTIEKPPSAELRPNQKDTDSLPDYAIVDRVVQGYVEDFLSAEQIASIYHFPLDLVTGLIRKIHQAEYKRRQAAPCIRVSKRAFLVGRHFPIVQKWN